MASELQVRPGFEVEVKVRVKLILQIAFLFYLPSSNRLILFLQEVISLDNSLDDLVLISVN
jgi:positive regulator of sigma E activity